MICVSLRRVIFLTLRRVGGIVGLGRVEGETVERVESSQRTQSFGELCSQDIAVEGSRCRVVWCVM